MTQNTSTAVMQRRVAGTDHLDFYPTPPWATRALCEWLKREIGGIEEIDRHGTRRAAPATWRARLRSISSGSRRRTLQTIRTSVAWNKTASLTFCSNGIIHHIIAIIREAG